MSMDRAFIPRKLRRIRLEGAIASIPHNQADRAVQLKALECGGAPWGAADHVPGDPDVRQLDVRFVVYSGPDIGTTFSVKAATADAAPHSLPALTLTRGARHMAFLRGGRSLVLLRGDIQHKDLWLVDLETGAERQLTSLALEFDIRDFDISPDGREVVLERVQERSNVVLLDLPRP
jgi:hypothetical protein